MTKPKVQRYVRRGGEIPQIYPGTLDGLNLALKELISASKFMPGCLMTLHAVYGRNQSTVIRRYKGGRLCPEPPDSEAYT